MLLATLTLVAKANFCSLSGFIHDPWEDERPTEDDLLALLFDDLEVPSLHPFFPPPSSNPNPQPETPRMIRVK